MFVKHASGEWLELKAQDYGKTRKPAAKTKGVLTLTAREGHGTITIPAGTYNAVGAVRIYRTIYRHSEWRTCRSGQKIQMQNQRTHTRRKDQSTGMHKCQISA